MGTENVQNKQIKIPVATFNDIDFLLTCIDLSSLDWEAMEAYLRIDRVFAEKKERAETRKTYFKLVLAQNEDERHEERINYLHRKR